MGVIGAVMIVNCIAQNRYVASLSYTSFYNFVFNPLNAGIQNGRLENVCIHLKVTILSIFFGEKSTVLQSNRLESRSRP